MPRGPDYTKAARSGYTVTYMREWIAASQEHYKSWKDSQNCDEIERILSGGKWHDIIIPQNESGEEQPWWQDRILVNLHLRVKSRLTSLVGDEKPEIRFTRDTPGAETVAEVIDRGVMREMQRMGAPEENAEGVGTVYSMGGVWYWIEIPELPMWEELPPATQSAADMVRAAAVGEYKVSRFQDHENAVAALTPTPGAPEAVNEEQGLRPDIEGQRAAAQAHADAKDAEEKGVPIYWRGEKGRIRLSRVRYGEDFVVGPIDRISRFRDAQFAARYIDMPLDEAREHPSFRPAAAKKLTATRVKSDDENRTPRTRSTPTQNTEDGDGGMVRIWIILDKKWDTVHLMADGFDEFLEKDSSNPYVDGRRRPIIPEVGEHPGFFPCVPATCLRIPGDDSEKLYGIPVGDPSHDIQKAYVKEKSWIHQSLKRASSVNPVAFGVEEADLEAIVSGEPKIIIANNPDFKIENPRIDGPKRDYMNFVNGLLSDWAMAAPYSMSRLTSSPQGETLGQEQIAVAGTDEAMFEYVRRLEVAYSHQALIVFKMMAQFYAPEVFDELLGPEEAAVFRMAIGRPTREDMQRTEEGSETYSKLVVDAQSYRIVDELPMTKFAPSSRERGQFARIKQALDTHDRAMSQPDPVTGAPALDASHLLQEASKMQGFGKIPPTRMTFEQKVVLAAAQLRLQQEEAEKAAAKAGGGERPNRDTKQRSDSAGRAEQPGDDSRVMASANTI